MAVEDVKAQQKDATPDIPPPSPDKGGDKIVPMTDPANTGSVEQMRKSQGPDSDSAGTPAELLDKMLGRLKSEGAKRSEIGNLKDTFNSDKRTLEAAAPSEKLRRSDGSSISVFRNKQGEITEIADTRRVSPENPKGIWRPEFKGAFVDEKGHYGYEWKDPKNDSLKHRFEIDTGTYTQSDRTGRPVEVWTGLGERSIRKDKGELNFVPEKGSDYIKAQRAPDGSISALRINNLLFVRDKTDNSKWTSQHITQKQEKDGTFSEAASPKSEQFQMKVRLDEHGLQLEQGDTKTQLNLEGTKVVTRPGSITTINKKGEETVAFTDEKGSIKQVITPDGSIYRRVGAREGEQAQDKEQWTKLGTKEILQGSWSLKPENGELKFSGALPSDAKDIPGLTYKRDSLGRPLEISSAEERRTFEYKDNKSLPSAFTINNRRFELDEKSSQGGVPVYNEKTESGRGQRILGAPDTDGSIRSFDPERKATVILKPDGTSFVHYEDGAMSLQARDGKITESIDANGVHRSYSYRKVDGSKEAQLNSITVTNTKTGIQEVWKTGDGFNWKVESQKQGEAPVQKEWQGLIKLDHKTASLIKTGADAKVEIAQLSGDIEKRNSFDLDARAKEIQKLLENPKQKDAMSGIVAQLQDLDQDQTLLLRKRVEANNPGRGNINEVIQSAFKDRPSYKQLELQLLFNRSGKPGEAAAIQLTVDAAEFQEARRNSWFGKTRSSEEITRSMRHLLGSSSEAERQGIDSALRDIHGGNGLKEFFEKGPGKDISSIDSYHQKLFALSAVAGVDKRSPEQQAELMREALKVTTGLDYNHDWQSRYLYFTEAASIGFSADEGRKLFQEQGGVETISKAFSTDKSKAQRYIEEAGEFAKYGETERLREFKRGFGLTGNAQKSMELALAGIPIKERLQLADGMAITLEGREPRTAEEKLAVAKFKEFSEAASSANWLFNKNNTQRYLDQSLRDGGTDISKILSQAPLLFSSREQAQNFVEQMDRKTFEHMLTGRQNESSPYQKQYLEALSTALGSGEPYKAAVERLKQKLDLATSIESIGDRIRASSDILQNQRALSELRASVPALESVDKEKWDSMLAGYTVARQLQKREKSPESLGKDELQKLMAYQDSPLKTLLEGNAISQRLRILEADNRFIEKAQKGELSGADLASLGLNAEQAKKLASMPLFARHEAIVAGLSAKEQDTFRKYQSMLLDASSPRFDQILENNKSTPAALLNSLRSLRTDDPALKRPAAELFQQLDEYIDSRTVPGFAARMIIEAKLKAGEQSPEGKLLSFSAELLADRVHNGKIDERELSSRLSRLLQSDKDGSIFAALKTNKQFQDTLNVIFDQDRKAAKAFLDVYSENGRLSSMRLLKLSIETHRNDEFGLFKSAILDASPQALRFLQDDKNPKAIAERKILLDRFRENGWGELAEKIIKAGEVKPEHLIRAAVLETGVSASDALKMLERMDSNTRSNTLAAYYDSFGSQARADLLKLDGGKNTSSIMEATRANERSAIQTQIIKQQEAFSTDTGLGADLGRLYSRAHLDQLSRYELARRLAGGELSGDRLREETAKLEEAIKTFKDTKKETIDAYVNGALMVAGLAAPPLIGFTSLAELSAATRVLMLTGAGGLSTGSKYLLKGNDESTLREIAGNFAEGALLFGTSFVGPEYAARLHGLGSKTAIGAVERGFSKLSGAELAQLEAAGIKGKITEDLKTLLSHSLAYGQNVKDDAIRKLVTSIPGLTENSSKKLAEVLLQGLKDEIPAQASKALIVALAASRELKALGVMAETGAASGFLVEGSNQLIKEQHVDVAKLVTATGTGAFMAGLVAVPLRGLTALSRHRDGPVPAERSRAEIPPDPDLRPLDMPRTPQRQSPSEEELPQIWPKLKETYPNASQEELLARAAEIQKIAKGIDTIRMWSYAEELALQLQSPEFAHLNNAQKVSLGRAIDHDTITIAELRGLSRKDLDALTRGFAIDDSLPPAIAIKVGDMYPWQQHAARVAWKEEQGRRGFAYGEDKVKVLEEVTAKFQKKFEELTAAGPEALLKNHPDVLTAIKQYHPDLGSTASVPLDAQSKEALNAIAAQVISENIRGEGQLAAIRKFSSKQFVEALEALDPGLKRLQEVAKSLNDEPAGLWRQHPAIQNYWEGHGALGLQSVFGKQWKQWLDLQAGTLSKDTDPTVLAQAIHDSVHWLPIGAPGTLDGLGPWLMKNARTPVNARKFAPISEAELSEARSRKVESLRAAGRDEHAIANESNLTRREIAEAEERFAEDRAAKIRASKQEALAKGEITAEKIEAEVADAEKQLALQRQKAQKLDDMGVVARRWHELSPEQRQLSFKDLVAAARSQNYLDAVSPEFATESARWGVPKDQYASIEARFLLSQKTPSPFPTDKSWSSGEYVGRFIPRSDVRGLYLGQHSACCQHPFDQGRTSAFHGQENPNGGFFIVTRKDNPTEIVAQSWAYVSKDGGLVFDSIESKQIKLLEESASSQNLRGNGDGLQRKLDEIAALRKTIAGVYEGAARELSQSQFHRVTVGTRYGRFSQYEGWPQAADRHLQLPYGYTGYSDAFDQAGKPMQRLLAENPILGPKEQGAPRPWVRAAESPAAAKAEAERIAKESFPEGWQFITEGNLTLLLEGEKAPVGYAILDTRNRTITDLAVLEQNRRHSKVLLDAILDYVERTGKEWTAAGARDSTSRVLLEHAAKSGRIEIIAKREVSGTIGADKRYDIVFKVKPKVKSTEQ